MSNGAKAAGAVGVLAAAAIGGKVIIHEGGEIAALGHGAGYIIENGGAAKNTLKTARDLPGVDRVPGISGRLSDGATNNFERIKPPLTGDPTIQQPRIALAQANQVDPSQKVSSLFDRADQNILHDLNALHGALTRQQIDNIIQEEVLKNVQSETSQPNSGIKFEALTGKLTIESSYILRGVKVTGGDVNIYKVSGVLAGSVYSCNALDSKGFNDCAKAALAKVGSVVAKELKLGSTE
jgi:hypothetical protein